MFARVKPRFIAFCACPSRSCGCHEVMSYWPYPIQPVKRKVFISYYASDKSEADAFVDHWANSEGIFIAKTIGLSGFEDFIDSTNSDYVIGQIRRIYLSDSTVTLVLIGKCTHGRRYVDWELKASLRQGDAYTPNGLIGILLPSVRTGAYLPPRFEANWNKEVGGYARYHYPPTTSSELSGWIEDAYTARTTRSHLIQNAAEMMKYNTKCRVCGVTH